jgi:hypothetical protein
MKIFVPLLPFRADSNMVSDLSRSSFACPGRGVVDPRMLENFNRE